MFSVHTKKESRCFQIPSGLKSVFEKFRFRDGYVWKEGLRFKIFGVYVDVVLGSVESFK